MTLPGTLALSLALLGGGTQFDGRFADYRWDVTPRPALGAQVLAETGRFATGIRLVQSRTTQTLGIPDPASAAAVHATSLEWVGRARIKTLAGFDFRADASSGWLRLGYHPDRVEIPAGSGTPAVTVALDPVNAWIAGAGLGISRPLAGPWSTGVTIERRFFSLETAHRNGGSIEVGRESFGDWSARLELAWRLGRS